MEEKITPLLQALVRINSVNPSLVAGGAGEAEIACFIRDWLRQRGIETEMIEAEPGRASVVGRVRGKRSGRSLLLNAHIDTVGVTGMDDPFGAQVRDGRLFGRGSYDMKGGLAACMMALTDIRDADLGGDVILAAVADEEHASLGMQSVLMRTRADAAIVTEPTELKIVVAHKGFSWHEIVTRGRAAHGSRPDLGVDAIAHMGRVLSRIEGLQVALSRRPPHPLLATGSVHASLIGGGQELSSYPETCTLLVERRTLPGDTGEAVAAELSTILGSLATEDPRFQAEHRVTLVRSPFSVSLDAPIVKIVHEQASRLLGKAPAIVGSTPWMDAAFLAEAGIPTVVLGPCGAGAHAIEEWVDLQSVEDCRHILVGAVRAFCQ